MFDLSISPLQTGPTVVTKANASASSSVIPASGTASTSANNVDGERGEVRDEKISILEDQFGVSNDSDDNNHFTQRVASMTSPSSVVDDLENYDGEKDDEEEMMETDACRRSSRNKEDNNDVGNMDDGDEVRRGSLKIPRSSDETGDRERGRFSPPSSCDSGVDVVVSVETGGLTPPPPMTLNASDDLNSDRTLLPAEGNGIKLGDDYEEESFSNS